EGLKRQALPRTLGALILSSIKHGEESTEEKKKKKRIALSDTNQASSSEDILGMVFKLAKKLKQTLADDARAAKPRKITMNHDTDEMLLFITKLKDTLTKEHGKNSAVKCPKYARGRYSNSILQ
ncbi:hypothetical protein HN011_010324, partial [Eciton burchellii]